MRWINHDTKNRKCHIVEVMKKFRLGLLDIESFLKSVEAYSYVTGNGGCRLIITDTLKFLHGLEMKTQKGGKISTRLRSYVYFQLKAGEREDV
jgi:hypothetical protein